MNNQNLSLQDIEKKGREIYENNLKTKLESTHKGKYVVIDVETNEYFMADFVDEALKKAKTKYPNKIFYTIRVGYPGVFSFSHKRYNDSDTRRYI